MRYLQLFCLVLLGSGVLANPIPGEKVHPDFGLNTLELLAKYGYPAEAHDVITEDGYVLQMHRIPHGILNNDGTAKPAVIVMHGLLSSSVDWVNTGPDKGLGFKLAEAGYDVWLGNCRGNTWSRKHLTLNPDVDKEQFWNFSWDEMGTYDLPAQIDHVIATTGQPQVFYVGHSQGTTSFFVMASQRPEYNDKIRLMSALAPVVYMNNLANPFLQVIAPFASDIQWITDFIGLYEFLPQSDLMGLIGLVACNDNSPFQEVCANILFLIAGYDSAQLDAALIPVITSNTPAGSSSRQMLHYAQGINSGLFRRFDHGSDNQAIYGQPEPPSYDLTKVTAPIALYYSDNDWLAAVTDVDRLYFDLPRAVYKYKVLLTAFNHLDYLWAIDVHSLVYDRTVAIMDRY